MGAHCFDSAVMQPLRRAARASYLTLVVGAGASVPSDLPKWGEFAENLLQASSGFDKEVLSELIASQGVRLATEAAMSGRNLKKRRDLIGKALYGKRARRDYVPTDLHSAVAEVAEERGPDAFAAVTLNYDDLIERAFELKGLPVRARSNAGYAGEAGVHTVHHLHGLLGSGRRQGGIYVVTESDYHQSRESGDDWRSGVVSEAAARGPVVFIGTSLSDPNLLSYLCSLRDRDGVGERIAVLSRQGLGIASHLHEQAEELLRKQWGALGVTPAFVQDFADVTTFVRELVIQRPTGRKSPRERLRSMWKRIEDTFEDHQAAWSDELSDTYANDLSRVLGREGNLVLWVADGGGHLVRLAANDRRHRDVRSLRRIPYRPDAGWVATDAVSFSEPDVVIRDLTTTEPTSTAVPSRRWRTVAGISLTVEDDDGARTVVGALTAATTKPNSQAPSQIDTDRWREAMTAAASEWTKTLSALMIGGR